MLRTVSRVMLHKLFAMPCVPSGSVLGARCPISHVSTPCRASGVVNYKVPPVGIRCGELLTAAHAWTTISTGATVFVSGLGTVDEAGEDNVDNGLSTRVRAGL